MDKYAEERYGPVSNEELRDERFPWRYEPRTDTPRDIARRRRQLWLALRDQAEVDDAA